MFYPYNTRQARFIAIAKELASEFSTRAANHDVNGTFPYENYADIRAAGLPSLIIPQEYGGWGASLLETVMVMHTLAQGDGSTALSLSMHMQTMGSAAEERQWPDPLFTKICQDSVERGALINAIATEPELGSPSRGGKPKTTAHPVHGVHGQPTAWQLNGHKNYASMIPALDYMITAAALQDGSDLVARFVIPTDTQGIEIVETWNAMGMRTTGSHDVLLKDVQVADENIIMRSDTTKPTVGGKTNAWFMLVISAVYVGVAEAALQVAAAYAKERVPTALGKPIATLESIQRYLGQAELLLSQAKTHLYHNAQMWDQHPDQRVALSPSVIIAKYTATNNAIAAVDHCMRVAGGVSMTKTLPLERYYRDVRGGLSHPVNDDQALVMLGRQVVDSI